jgi:hypothetical protein
MSGARTTAVSLIASVLTSCATTPPSAPDTETQRKVRADLQQCDTAAGRKAHIITASPEGKYSFEVYGQSNADAILACMMSKGYSGVRLDGTEYPASRARTQGEGQPLR